MPVLKFNLDNIKSYNITPGRYRLKLMKVEQTLSSTSKKPMYVWHWKIVSGAEKGKTVRSWTLIGEGSNLSNLKAHLEAFGMTGKVSSTTDKLVGRTIIATITNQVTTNPKTKADSILPTLISLERDPKDVEAMEDHEDEDEETEVEDEDEEEPRSKKKAVANKKKSKFSKAVPAKRKPVEDEDEDEDDEDEDDEEDEDEDDVPF